MRLSDAQRRGLRTAIDLLLSGGLTGLILFVLNAVGVDVTLEQFTAVILLLTPLLSVVKNALEDRSGKAFLVSKARPEPDPIPADEAPVEPVEQQVDVQGGGAPGLVTVLGPLPPGLTLVALAPEDVAATDKVVGYTG